MRTAGLALTALAALVAGACSSPPIKDPATSDIANHVPATLEAERPREGDPHAVELRVWVDPGVRALPKWKEEITEQIDYASQLLTPLLGARLSVKEFKDWPRAGDPQQALQQLTELDKGDGVTWVLGYITPNDTASKAMSELGSAHPLGHHVIIRGWAEKAETEALASSLPDLKEAERTEIFAAHRRHKQTVVLLHQLAITLGAIAEVDPTWIAHPTYSPKQAGFADRTRELLTLAMDARVAEATDLEIAKKLVDAIERSEWGGWIPAQKEETVGYLRNVIDASKAGKIAADIPPAAYDHITRIKELAKRGDVTNAISDLDNLLTVYPGHAGMHQLKCDILLGARSESAPRQPALAKPGVADPKTRAACKRASELAPGDPTPHLAVAEALARTGDAAGARAELVLAEPRIGNLPTGSEEAWRRLIAIYQAMGALTWTDEAIAKAKLENDPIAAQVTQTRARYGVPRGTKLVTPDQEAALVAAVRKALEQVYSSKYGDAEKTLAAAEKKWPGAPGLAAARCDLALRLGQIDAARASCNKALAAYPDESWALYLSGVLALKDASGTKTGIDQLKKAIAVDPDLAQAWRTLAKAYQRAKDKAALEQLGKDYQAKFGQPLPP